MTDVEANGQRDSAERGVQCCAAFAQIASYVAMVDVQSWPAPERRSLVEWLRAKGAATEHRYAQFCTAQQRFFRELTAVGRAEQRRGA